MEEVGARVSLKNARKAQRDAKGVSREVRGIGDASARASRRMAGMNSSARRLAGGVGTLSRAAGIAVAAGGALTVAVGVRAYKAFDEARKIAAQTEAAIKATGGAANITAQEVGDLATAIQLKTGIDDESIRKGSNLLLTFKQIRNEAGRGNDVFNQATMAAIDLSAAGFGSIDSASKMLGKALNDPVKGLTAMGRAGVTFTDQQKDQIKTLVESNRTLDAQKIILREINSQVGGSAEAQATPMMKLQTTIGDLEEEIGSGITPTVDKFATDLNNLGRRALPGVGRAARRLGGIMRSENLDMGERMRFGLRAIEQEVGPVVRPLVASVQREVGRIDFGKAASGAIEKGAPVMADAFARQVPNMMRAFANAFVNAGPGGQLLTAAVLYAKFGAFRSAGGWAAGQFLTTFRRQATTAGTFGSVGRSGGRALGDGLVVYGAGEVKKGARGGRFDRAGQMAGAAMGVAGAAYMAKELGDGLRKHIDDASKKGGIQGFLGSLGGAVDDVARGGGKLAQFGPQAPIIAATKDAKRRLDGRPKTKTVRPVNIPSPMGNGQRQGSIGRGADVTSRGAGFGLPGAQTSMPDSFEATIVLQLPDGQKQNVKAEMKRARRR